MPALPPGWRLSNSTGVYEGRAREDDDLYGGDGSDEGDGGLDIEQDSPGWEDVEEDTESLRFKCLLCDETFPSAELMLGHCKAQHAFDFLASQMQLRLDFYATIKLVNYIRSEVQHGHVIPDMTTPGLWDNDQYLQPVLQDDALLFTLDEVVDFGTGSDAAPVDYDERQQALNQPRTELDSVQE